MTLGVYVHWPYCARICPYCDFNVYRARGADPEPLVSAILADLAGWRARLGPRTATSLYFGGGTPSLMPPGAVAQIVDACVDAFGLAPDAEITLEANPAEAAPETLNALADAGVNRLSLGVQALRDDALSFLGRDHDARTARRAIAAAQAAFPRITFDLIYGRPEQTPDDWRAELVEALSFGATHLSLYQLTIEPGTAFAKAVARGAWSPPDADRSADLYDIAQEITASAGLAAYEVSNHARADAQAQHNLVYWRYQDYLGLGPGAHGRVTLGGVKHAVETALRPADYVAAVERTGTGATLVEPLDARAQSAEHLLMGLRLSEGVSLARHAALSGAALNAAALSALESDGLVVREGDRLRATANGRRVLDAVLRTLINDA